MSYNSSIPIGTDPILRSQRQIKANFQAINVAFADNHIGLTQDPEFSGMHKLMNMRPQAADPATSATQVALYTKIVSSIPQLFFRPNSSQTPIQLTYQSIKTDDTSNDQYSFMAGPFIVYGGFRAAVVNGSTITLSPGTTLLYVDLTVASFSLTPLVLQEAIPTNISGTQFTVKFQATNANTYDIYYFAIGI